MPADRGQVLNIQKFSIHDGPGIRTVVFLKGCPMSCPWCANPGSRKLQALQVHDPDWPGVLVPDSRQWTVQEVLDVVMQDRPFYEESGGGATLSGGEVLVQHRFAVALLDAFRAEGLNNAIETTGYCAPAIFEKVLDRIDTLLIDVKHWDAVAHRVWTGVDDALPKANLRRALDRGVPTVVRIPCVPGVNITLDDAHGFARVLRDLGVEEVQLLPFHQFGERKYELLDWEYRFSGVPALHEEDLEDFRRTLAGDGVAAYF